LSAREKPELSDAAGADGGRDDAALMTRVQAGDEVAFGSLMEEWELPVKRLLGRIVLNASEAEELAQETFVRLWQQREKFRVGAALRPWLFSIAVNLARNRLRWWRTRPTIALEEWTEDSKETENGAAVVERRERAAAISAAVADLPVDLREALVLSVYEQFSHAEIAVAVGATTKAVESRIARARERVKKSLRLED
jgi:RNA polymerase sigma factor (sigma-70 family)